MVIKRRPQHPGQGRSPLPDRPGALDPATAELNVTVITSPKTPGSVLLVSALAGTLIIGTPAEAKPPGQAKQAGPRVRWPSAAVEQRPPCDADATRAAITILRRRAAMRSTPRVARGRDPRRDRTVLSRHRRRRLLPLLQRQDGVGAPRSTVGSRHRRPCRKTRSSIPRPGRRTPSTRPGSAASRSACPALHGPGRPLLQRWGTLSMREALRPAIEVAKKGFEVDQTFATQVNDNAAAFAQFSSTSALEPPTGRRRRSARPSAPRSGPDVPPARSTGRHRPSIAATSPPTSSRTVQQPPLATTPAVPWAFPIRPGELTSAPIWPAIRSYAEADPSALSRLRRVRHGHPVQRWLDGRRRTQHRRELGSGRLVDVQALHRYLEASALAYADRGRYVGDDTPRPLLNELLKQRYANERACQIDPTQALPKPVAPGRPRRQLRPVRCRSGGVGADRRARDDQSHRLGPLGQHRRYTLTIEATGGNAMVVPGRGFLLNNELTDFNFMPTQGTAPDPNLPAPGKRPRSSISPTILLATAGRSWPPVRRAARPSSPPCSRP